jgi:predicted AAA+ superfamily ATPase
VYSLEVSSHSDGRGVLGWNIEHTSPIFQGASDEKKMSIKTIFDTCTPRAEVLTGELKEHQFAASLTKVLRGTADPIYGDAATFFANTYATKGLKSLLHEALGRLSGKRRDSASVIRLETNFGGGKSHNLIGLYHVCDSEIDPNVVEGFVDMGSLPGRPIAKIAGIVGPDVGVADGVDHGDVRTYTLWGELAHQIGFRTGGAEGGKAAYELVRKSDEGRTAPSTQPWEKLIGDDPALIMIDEIGQYLRVSAGVQVGKTTLADQTVAFLMSLMKFAAESQATVLVYTLADSGDAFGRESDMVREALAESKSVSARSEHVLTPTAEDEISAVVSHRMFAEIDKKAAKEVARCYADYYGRMVEQEVDLPQRSTRSAYTDDIVKDYPFHPELLTTLNRKTSNIPNFQRTRGVLRILAQTIRMLWEQKPKDCYLIAPFCMDLADDRTANDLTSRLDRPQYKQVIEADIASWKDASYSNRSIRSGYRISRTPRFAISS